MTRPPKKGAYVKANSGESVTLEGVTISRETERAVLVTVNGTDYWMPLSQIVRMTRTKDKDADTITISAWIAKQKGLA